MRRQQLIIIALVAIALFILFRQSASASNGEQWTVYGTMGCGWTRKQLDYMKKAGKPFVFVDCDKNECEGMDAFPTLVSPKGVRHKGYKEV